MKISILCSNLSTNGMMRCIILAQALQPYHNVNIVGPMRGKKIWAAMDCAGIPVIPLEAPSNSNAITLSRQMIKQIDADLVYVDQLLVDSLIPGLWFKWKKGVPLIVDIADWQMGFWASSMEGLTFRDKLHHYRCTLKNIFRGFNGWNVHLCEKLVRYADAITVSSQFLNHKYGGEIIWQGQDARVFDPSRVDRDGMRSELHVNKDVCIILFLGSFRPHKGLDVLINAVCELKNKNILLALVGKDETAYATSIEELAKRTLGHKAIVLPTVPFSDVPKYLAASDVVVIPQRNVPAAQGQMPTKVFDAMAMQKTIIASSVGDLEIVLDGCGWIVPPDDPLALQEIINYVLDHPEEALRRAANARAKFLERYSNDVIGQTLNTLVRKLMKPRMP